ncbi:MarR family transcriptional regulator [Burkholderia ubonensis]|nr:MarR family transcriptional regulator [Burkholderia ubonensis]
MTQTDSLLSNLLATSIPAMTNLRDLRLAVSSKPVLAARTWRRTSGGVPDAYNASDATASRHAPPPDLAP